MPASRARARLANMALLVATLALCFVAGEAIIRMLPAAERLGFSDSAPVGERVAAAGPKQPGRTRILALGDSFTEWRDRSRGSFVRVAERALNDAGKKVEVVNLAEAGTGIPEYFANFVRNADALKPDLVVVGLYLGNDLRQSDPPLASAQGRAAALAAVPPKTPAWRLLLKKSILLDTVFRFAKTRIAALRSGSFDALVAQLAAREKRNQSYIAERLSHAEPALVDAARADLINVWDLATAVFFPDYYGELAEADPATRQGREVAGGMADLDALIAECRTRNLPVVVVLLPPPPWAGERYRDYFRRLGYGALGPAEGPVPVIELLKTHLAEGGATVLDALPVLRAERERSYLENDEHLNGHGQEVVGNALAGLLTPRL
jgi:lysophospholipase L1-like esterase